MKNNNNKNSIFNREIDKITDEITCNLSDNDHLKNYNDLCLRIEPIIDNIKDLQEKMNQEINKLFSKEIGKYDFLHNFDLPEKNIVDFNDYKKFIKQIKINDREVNIIYLDDLIAIRESSVGDHFKVQYLNIIISKMKIKKLEFIIL